MNSKSSALENMKGQRMNNVLTSTGQLSSSRQYAGGSSSQRPSSSYGKSQSNAISIKLGHSHSGPCKFCILNAKKSSGKSGVTIPPCHPNCRCSAHNKKNKL